MFIGPPGADSTRWHKLGVHIVLQIVKYIGLLSWVSSTSRLERGRGARRSRSRRARARAPPPAQRGR